MKVEVNSEKKIELTEEEKQTTKYLVMDGNEKKADL